MKAVRRINNNVAVCVDNAGNELLAMGKGVGFGQLPRELTLAEVERTFYDVDERYFAAINDLPQDVLSFAIVSADYVRNELPYELCPNLAFILADHLSFAIERAKKNMKVRMPLAYDVEQTYPNEYRLGRHIMRRARKQFGVPLPDDESVGITLNIINARLESADETEEELQRRNDEMLEDATEIIEDEFDITLDRSSFAFSRYATHMRYLFERLHTGKDLNSSCIEGFRGIEGQFPRETQCVRKIARHIAEEWPEAHVSGDECLYLVIHVSRLCIKGSER